jgi:hypothetical protein
VVYLTALLRSPRMAMGKTSAQRLMNRAKEDENTPRLLPLNAPAVARGLPHSTLIFLPFIRLRLRYRAVATRPSLRSNGRREATASTPNGPKRHLLEWEHH